MRESVEWFAQQMEQKLQENDHKSGWEGFSLMALMLAMAEECFELVAEIEKFDEGGGDLNRIIDEAADVSNFAHMIADNARELLKVRREGH